MRNELHPMTATRYQSNIAMLRSSLKQVFPAQDDRSFGDLLRQLDQPTSTAR